MILADLGPHQEPAASVRWCTEGERLRIIAGSPSGRLLLEIQLGQGRHQRMECDVQPDSVSRLSYEDFRVHAGEVDNFRRGKVWSGVLSL